MPRNRDVYYDGEVIDSWACDVNFNTGETESNGSQEFIVEYKGKRYSVIISWQNEVRNPDGEASEYIDGD